MTKPPIQVKNLIEEWSKEWGYTIKDTTAQQGSASVEWVLEINNGRNSVIAITEKKLKDVLKFQTQINFSPEHQQKTAQLPNEEYNKFVLETTDRLAYLGCDWIFVHDQQNQKQMNSLVMFNFVVYEKIDKNTVLQMLNRAFINMAQMVRAISISLNKGGNPQMGSTSTNNSIYG